MNILAAVHRLIDLLLHRYRPELHYMRGPGPAYARKHSRLD